MIDLFLLVSCLCNKQNNTWLLGDMEFLFSFSTRYLTRFTVLTRGISNWTLEHPKKNSVVFPPDHLLGSLRFDDGNVNDNATNQWFHWLNEEKWSCCPCGTLFGAMFWRSLPNDDVKFSYLRFWRQRELAAVNLSFFAFKWKPFVPSKRKCTPPILYDVINME